MSKSERVPKYKGKTLTFKTSPQTYPQKAWMP